MKQLALVIFVLALLFVIPFCFFDFENPKQKDKIEIPLRFQKVEEFMFHRFDAIDARATVFEDTETGIEYLYIWGGTEYGGPAITRLWEKKN